jgi:hypothetical protein
MVDTGGKSTGCVTAINVYLTEDVTTGVIDTGGKLAAGVNCSIPIVDTSPMSLIAVSHCELRISLQIFEKIWMSLIEILGALGKMISEKT